MVTALDESVGRILARLRQTGHHDNTIVVFTSDNGAGETLTTLQSTDTAKLIEIEDPPTISEVSGAQDCMIFSD